MDRRSFIQTAAIGSLAVCGCSNQKPQTGRTDSPASQSPANSPAEVEPDNKKSHVVTLSFDDGFKKSFFKVADIYEGFGLQASLNVIASAHLPEFKAVDDWILPELMGNFEDWNALKERGHEIMPHSWRHRNLAKLPFEEAATLIDRCLDYFEENLAGYDPQTSVFNFPFNASNRGLEQHALKRVRAVRSGGDTAVNAIPGSGESARLSCWCYGRPDNCDDWIEKQIQKFLRLEEGGWLILNLHGLDDEGWAPISTKYLTGLLEQLVATSHVSVLPVEKVLSQAAGDIFHHAF